MDRALVVDWKSQGTVGLFGLLCVFGLNRSGLDVWTSAQFYDLVSSSFPLRDGYFYSEILHTRLKYVSTTIWLLMLLCSLVFAAMNRLNVRSKFAPGGWTQSAIKYILIASVTCAGLVAWLKSLSAHSCPWDLTAFGGSSGFFYLGSSLSDLTLNMGPGKCFPSGHASVGWMWIGLLFVPSQSKAMAWIKRAMLLLAFLVSVTQVVRGAHFPSHVLMTAVICWVSSALIYHAYPWLFKTNTQVSRSVI